MSAVAIAQYLQWIGIVCTVLMVAGMVVQALLMTRPRQLRGGVLVLVALFDLAAVFALYWFSNVFLNLWWMAGLAMVGLVVGWLVGGGTKTAEKDGRVYVKLSPLAPWLVALLLSVSVGALFFAPVGLFAAALLLSLYSVGMLLGQAVSASMKRAGAKSKAPVAVGAPLGSEEA